MPRKGQSLSDEAKQRLREARAKQIHPSLAARGITQVQIDEAANNGMRWCGGGCAQFRPLSDFTATGKKCRDCNRVNRAKWRTRATPERLQQEAANIKIWRADNAAYVRDQEIQKTYGVDLGWYERQLGIQDGHCALCPAIPVSATRQYLCIDHHHDSGKVRELLCNSCNYMLGFLEKKGQIRKFIDGQPDIEWGERAASYLLRHQ